MSKQTSQCPQRVVGGRSTLDLMNVRNPQLTARHRTVCKRPLSVMTMLAQAIVNFWPRAD